jgi:hypothetical protein
MPDLRSRAGFVGLTTAAAALLAMPVVAVGQVPGLDGVVGGVKERVQNAAPRPPVNVPAPPVDLPARPAPPAPAPKGQGSPPAQGPAVQAPPASPQAPPAHARAKKLAGSGGGEQPGPAPSPSPNEPAAGEGGGSGDGGSKAGGGDGGGGDDGKTVDTSQDDGGTPTDVEIADEVVEAPVDASPSTLPFTGFQLALIAALGLAALGTGLGLRRGARSAG